LEPSMKQKSDAEIRPCVGRRLKNVIARQRNSF
jgi:hypothetical protein